MIGLAQIILSTIAGLVGRLPVSSQMLSGTFTVGQQTVSYVPKQRTRGRFKKDYNSVAVSGGHPEIQLHLTIWERI